MKGIKACLYAVLCIGLAHCGNQSPEFTQDENMSSIVMEKTPPYIGPYTHYQYFHGGGLPQPGRSNLIMNLHVSIDHNGVVKGQMDTPECKTTGELSMSQFSNLARVFGMAKLQQVPVNMPIAEDAPEIYIQATNTEEKKRYFFRNNYPQLTTESADAIKDSIDDIVATLDKNCGVTNEDNELASLRISEKVSRFSPYMIYPVGENSTDRNFIIKNKDGVLTVSGREVISNGAVKCVKTLTNQRIHPKILKSIEKIDFVHADIVCMLFAAPGNYLRFVRTDKDGSQSSGAVGCWNSEQAINSNAFTKKFKKYLNEFPSRCTRSVGPIKNPINPPILVPIKKPIHMPLPTGGR